MSMTRTKLRRELHDCVARLNQLAAELDMEEFSGTPNSTNAVRRIASAMGTTLERIRKRSNEQHIVIRRQMCQYVLRHGIQASYHEIAKATGLNDHTTIMHSLKKIEAMRVNPEFDKRIRDLLALFLDRNTAKEDEAVA